MKDSDENILVYCSFASSGVWHLHWIDSAPIKKKHHFILQRHSPPSGLIFVEKDSSCSRIKCPTPQSFHPTTEGQRRPRSPDFLDCPPQLADLNHIQHLWWHMKTEKAKHPLWHDKKQSVTSQKALLNCIYSDTMLWDQTTRITSETNAKQKYLDELSQTFGPFCIFSSNYETEGSRESFNSQTMHAGKSANVICWSCFHHVQSSNQSVQIKTLSLQISLLISLVRQFKFNQLE